MKIDNTQMINPEKDWFFWGIGPKISDYSHSSYIDEWVRGICARNAYKPWKWKNNGAKFDPSEFGNCEIDIYLDLDARELRMCIVGVNGDNQFAEEAISYNISTNEGYVPHFNFASASVDSQRIQVARIPLDWCGKKAKIEWIRQ